MSPEAGSPPCVIEFVGAPGAGKSTLVPTVLEAVRAAGLVPRTNVGAARPLAARTLPGRLLGRVPEGRFRRRALWSVFLGGSAWSAVDNTVRTWPLLRRVLRSQWGRPAGAEAGRRRVVYWFVRLLGTHGLFLRRARSGEVLVLDEGYVHRVVQLFTSAIEDPDPVDVRDYLSTVPAPDLLVAVHVPVEACVDRVIRRGVWARLEGRDVDELRRFVHHAHRAAELAVTYAREHAWDLIEIDNSRDGSDASVVALRTQLADRFALGVGARP